MPAKLQLDVLRDPAVQRSSWNANAEKPQLSRALPQRPTAAPLLCLRFTQVAPYFIIQLFDLPSRHAEKLGSLACLLSNPIH
nr:ASN_HP1_G0038540.mRNA.1.CDS.1 [Saccharomyces cerevisiae]